MKQLLFFLFSSVPLLCGGAPYYQEDSLSFFRNDLRNLEVEVKQLNEKAANQQTALESIQEEIAAASKNRSLEKKVDQLLEEIQLIKSHANKLADEVEVNRQKSLEVEGQLAAVQNALSTVMDALGVAPSSGKVYTVKPGDSLGGIAQKHRTTIQALKKANNLKKDIIFVGQKLTLP